MANKSASIHMMSKNINSVAHNSNEKRTKKHPNINKKDNKKSVNKRIHKSCGNLVTVEEISCMF